MSGVEFGQLAALFAGACLLSIVATAAARPLALRLGLVDRPDGVRKLHKRPTPLVGGIAIAIACFGSICAFLLYHAAEGLPLALSGRDLISLAVGGTLIVGLGVFDDVRGATPRLKLLVQGLAATVMIGFGFRLDYIVHPFGEAVPLGILSFPLTLLWILFCTNALNLIDGLDGLASGVMLIAISAVLGLAVVTGNVVVCVVGTALAGAIVGFLVFNRPPASAFLGDSGSMLLGFLFSAIAFRGVERLESGFALLVPLIIFGLPIIDLALAVARRWLNDLPIFSPDRKHLHHRLLDIGFTPWQAVLMLHGMCLFLAVTGFLVAINGDLTGGFLLAGIVGVTVTTLRVLWGIWLSRLVCGVTVSKLFAQAKSRSRRRQLSLECWIQVQQALSAIAGAEDAAALWKSLTPLFNRLRAERALLSLRDYRNGSIEPSIFHQWQANGNGSVRSEREALPRSSSIQLPITSKGRQYGLLYLQLGDETRSIPGWYTMLERVGIGTGHRLHQLWKRHHPRESASLN